MPPVGFEPTISAGERLQTHALDRAATGTGVFWNIFTNISERNVAPFFGSFVLLKAWSRSFFTNVCAYCRNSRLLIQKDLNHYRLSNFHKDRRGSKAYVHVPLFYFHCLNKRVGFPQCLMCQTPLFGSWNKPLRQTWPAPDLAGQQSFSSCK